MFFCDFPMIIVFVLLLVLTSNSKLELDDGFRCIDEIDVFLRNSHCFAHEIYVKYFLFPTLNFISSSVINIDLSFNMTLIFIFGCCSSDLTVLMSTLYTACGVLNVSGDRFLSEGLEQPDLFIHIFNTI